MADHTQFYTIPNAYNLTDHENHVKYIFYLFDIQTMNKHEDGQLYTENGVEYFQHGSRSIEIAGSYPDIETALAALKENAG